MYDFIQNNIIWIVPIVSIILTVIIKISSKPSSCTLNYVDYLDFGFDLSISSIIVLLTGINEVGGNSNNLGIWLILLSFMLVMIISIIVNRLGWNRETGQIKLIGVLIPDIIGVILLVISTLYIGGLIR